MTSVASLFGGCIFCVRYDVCAGFLLSHPDPCPFVRVHPSLLVYIYVCLYV
jgi:hypothetical protein